MNAFLEYAVISLMGVCQGMIGAGGSILALPVMVYLFRVEPTLATAYTSIVVGITAAAGALVVSLIGGAFGIHQLAKILGT